MCIHFYALGSNDLGHIVYVLTVCLSVVNFNLCYNQRKRKRLHNWYAYSTTDALSIDTKVNDLVTLNLNFVLKIVFFKLT